MRGMSSENKTIPTTTDVVDFLSTLDDEQQRRDSETLVALMERISSKPPVMWGPSIIGFGSYHYRYDSGREGDMPKIGFSPRKGKFALYITDDAEKYRDEFEGLGKYKTSKGCIYINKLADVDVDKLKVLITKAYKEQKRS
jgi:hypothetical protein